jgi:hypothetical protein
MNETRRDLLKPRRVLFFKLTCSVEKLCEHACPMLNHQAKNSRVYAALYL